MVTIEGDSLEDSQFRDQIVQCGVVNNATIQEKQPCRKLQFEDDEGLTNSSVNHESIESLHKKLSEANIPTVGMEFESEDDAYNFYNAYALLVGFSVRKGNCHKEKGLLMDRTFVCSCEGKRGKDKRDDVYKSHQPETRFGCLAKLKVSCRQYYKYRVVKFNAEHNHNLASPRKAHLFRSHRNVSTSQASVVDNVDMSGIAPKNAYEFMAREVGGREHLGFAHVDIKNYLRTKRSSAIKSGETGGVLEYMQRMREEDSCFFYAIQVDEDDLITNIFWADSTMIADFEDFGDVVFFDTTYRKHEDGRPIALFVGVNHHIQTTIFGVALFYDETADSFVWLFDTFFRAMGEKSPKTILTDQDAAMAKALAAQWPHTNHRLCIWHIFQNAATHLAYVFSRDKSFSKDLSDCVYGYEHEEEFLEAWNNMLEKYELQDNDWMKRMFSIREKWALVYGKDTFSADMTTTQRSESINAMIKHYVSYKDNLSRFFKNFQRLLDDRRYDEMVADFKTSQSKLALAFPAQILKHAACIYTPTVYKLFEEELCKALDCKLEISEDTDLLVKYMITPYNKRHNFIVSCDEIEKTICCNCRKFEFAGLLCCHVLKVLTSHSVTKIPDKYVLKRWTKNAKKGPARASTESSAAEPDPKKAAGMRYRDLCRLSTRLVTRAAESEEGYIKVKEVLLDLFRDLDLNLTKGQEQPSLGNDHLKGNDLSHGMPTDASGTKQMVKGIKIKQKSGSAKSKRPQSALEKATRKNRKAKLKKIDKVIPCSTSSYTEQHTIPIIPRLGNQIVQEPGYIPPQPVYFFHPWEAAQYSSSMSFAQSNLDMNVTSLSTQTDMQLNTQENVQFRHDYGRRV